MHRTTSVFALLLSVTAIAGAQSSQDFAAWWAIMETPAGAFAPYVVVPASRTPSRDARAATRTGAFQLSRWKMDASGADPVYNFGGTYMGALGGNAVLAGTFGYLMPTCSGCNGAVMVGADLHSAIVERQSTSGQNHTAFDILTRLSVGYSHWTEGAASALSAVGSVPFVLRGDLANGSSFTMFLSPGLGVGRLADAGNSESGSRPLFGGGCSFTSANGVGIHFGAQKVLIKDPAGVVPVNFGLTFSLSR